MVRHRPPAPDYPRVRHGKCGKTYNKLKWGQCPHCESSKTGQFALICSNGHTFVTAEREDLCPECDWPESGNTSVVAAPGGV